jgi:hypothetical protein
MTTQQENPQVPPFKVAFIIDNEVVDVLHTDERLLAVFTSNPVIVDVTNTSATDTTSILPGAKYNSQTGEFVNPEYDPPTPQQIEEAQRTMAQAKAAGLIQ